MQRRPRIDLPEEVWDAMEEAAEQNGLRREYAYKEWLRRGFEDWAQEEMDA